MGNSQTIQKINFEDVQVAYKNPEIYLIINTLSETEQHCLRPGTISANVEESVINKYVRSNKNVRIIIYGRNSNDDKMYKKYNQLLSLGFMNVYAYTGGMFEWLLLQDIYGTDEFPTTTPMRDILKYKPVQRLNIALLENG